MGPPTEPAAQGEEYIEGKLTSCFYTLKEGARLHVYDISTYVDNSVDDKTKLAEVFSDDESDFENAATLQADAAGDVIFSKSKNIKAQEIAALGFLKSVGAGVKQEGIPDLALSSDSEAEPANLFSEAVRGGSSSSSKSAKTFSSSSVNPVVSSSSSVRPSVSIPPVTPQKQTSHVKRELSLSPTAASVAPAGAETNVPASDEVPGKRRPGRPRVLVSLADNLDKSYQDACNLCVYVCMYVMYV